MDRLICAEARRHLAEFYDRELVLDEQIAVEAHLTRCASCAGAAGELRSIGDALRSGAAGAPLSRDEVAGLEATVVGRITAERDHSVAARVGRMFEDMHLVWAALAATAATTVCMLLMVGLTSFAPAERADSLSGIMAALASPGSNANPVRPDGHVRLPRVAPDAIMPTILVDEVPSDEELVFALAAVVTREGRVVGLEVLLANEDDRRVVTGLLHAASAARFEPARFAGAPVAVNMIWVVTHTTVRGKLLG